ncbi:MAG: hypothetical protein WCO42_04255 [bacterium]
MSLSLSQPKTSLRSARWEASLVKLARCRGDSEAISKRAVELSRQLNISPWIALGIAERLISLKDARMLDRVGRCKELQCAILDKRRSMDELRVMMPYAVHFLAVELMDVLGNEARDVRVVIRILNAVLSAECKRGDDETSFRVRTRPIGDYAAIVRNILGIMRRTRCDVRMAQDIDAGHLTEQFAIDHVRQRRRLAMEEHQLQQGLN